MAAAVLFVVQQIQHTSIVFSALFFAYVMLTVFAFNYAGGFSRVSGAYIFWFGLLVMGFGVCWKALLGEPADSNLVTPNLDMALYAASMAMIFASLLVSRRLIGKPPGLSTLIHAGEVNLGMAALGCAILSQIIASLNGLMAGSNGSLMSILNQENIFLPVSIMLATIHTIRVSRGTRSVNLVSLYASLSIFIFGGLIAYSKEGAFEPMVCWLVAAASQRYRIRLWQLALLIAFGLAGALLLAPLSQVARAVAPEGATAMQRLRLSVDLLSHPARLRYEAIDVNANVGRHTGYYNDPQGFADRLTIAYMDDQLISYTAQGHEYGYGQIRYAVLNWLPHFILPNKEKYAPPEGLMTGNVYAHEVGNILSDSDHTTGISFSPTAEAFHAGGWAGVLLVAPLVWILLFTVTELVCGDLRRSPYGLFAAVLFAHIAPESLLVNLIYFIWYKNLGIVIVTVFCSYIAPVMGQLFSATRLSGGSEPLASSHGTRLRESLS